jgi:drug/metabolite transporter (DMT)-like permease
VTGAAPRRSTAVLLGVIVTFLWSSSVVLIRLGLTEEDVDPIGFAGVRFALAAILLLPLAAPRLRAARVWEASPRSLLGVAVYGLLMFCVAQVAFYVALGDLTASTVGLLMALAPIVTAVMVMRSKHERASLVQVGGISVLIIGVVVYFGVELPNEAGLALLAGAAIPLVVGASARLGRYLAVDAQLFGGPLGLTALAMVVGGFATLILALIVEGIPAFSARAWLLIIWLAAVNTALTYTLWTQSQRSLRAVESSVLGDLTVILIALLGWIVLGEALDLGQVLGLLLVLSGVVIVQFVPIWRRRTGSGDTPLVP